MGMFHSSTYTRMLVLILILLAENAAAQIANICGEPCNASPAINYISHDA